MSGDELDEANDVNVVGGTINVADAALVQSIDAYDAVDSGYIIEDSAGSVLGAQATILDSGVAHVDVNSIASANVGVALGNLEDSLEAG